jgi:hypothetical protein
MLSSPILPGARARNQPQTAGIILIRVRECFVKTPQFLFIPEGNRIRFQTTDDAGKKAN